MAEEVDPLTLHEVLGVPGHMGAGIILVEQPAPIELHRSLVAQVAEEVSENSHIELTVDCSSLRHIGLVNHALVIEKGHQHGLFAGDHLCLLGRRCSLQ